MKPYINHVGRFWYILPLPLRGHSYYVEKWSLITPPQLSTWFMYDPYGIYKIEYLNMRRLRSNTPSSLYQNFMSNGMKESLFNLFLFFRTKKIDIRESWRVQIWKTTKWYARCSFSACFIFISRFTLRKIMYRYK